MPKASVFAKLPGFRDFLPEEFALRNHLFEIWRGVSHRHGFMEYDGPPLEGLNLYTQKSGDEIVAQLYEFVDKGDRAVALRPEMTPTLARILGQHSRSMSKPIRWFSIPQLFRYERQQRGRLREHFQWNVDLVGDVGVEGDAEVLAMALAALSALGLGVDDIRARISDRTLLSALLTGCGVPEAQLTPTFAVVDKAERESREKLLGRLCDPSEVGLDESVAQDVLALFDAPGSLDELSARYGDVDEVGRRIADLRQFLGVMEDLGFGAFVEFDLTIVRGLAYYTGIVFEVFDRQGEFRAICGGGRYDQLLAWAGGEPLPAVGFGMGDVVLGELLKARGLVPEYRRTVDYFIVSIGDEQRPPARRLANALRQKGFSVTYALRELSVRKQFAAAQAEGADRVVVLGPDEHARNVAVVRDMASGEESELPLDAVGNRTEDG